MQPRAGCSSSPAWQSAPTHCQQGNKDKSRLAASWDQTRLPAQCTRVTYVTTGLARPGTLLGVRGDMNIMSPDGWRGLGFDFFSFTTCQELGFLASGGSQNENHTCTSHRSSKQRLSGIYWWYKTALLCRGLFHPLLLWAGNHKGHFVLNLNHNLLFIVHDFISHLRKALIT